MRPHRLITLIKRLRRPEKDCKLMGHMALGHLVYATLDHASMAICHPDDVFIRARQTANSKTKDEWGQELKDVVSKVKHWVSKHPWKVALMVIGLGSTAFKAKTIGQHMLDVAVGYCVWSRRQNLFIRFWGFVALMSVRLVVSTLVPPTSPSFGIIIQAATPDEQMWTAMPCFLAASAVAGAWPWLFDKLLQLFTRQDFYFTMAAKRFADNYPLTCWTGPAMREAYHCMIGEGEQNGKLAASFVVIVGHVVPFMGAQTTVMQQYYLPHPADTLASQPFGMTEDLVSMAMAEATSNPMLASASLTALITFFNLARGLVFSVNKEKELQQQDSRPSVRGDVVTDIEDLANKESSENQDTQDYVALAAAALNIVVGIATAHMVSGGISLKQAFCVVALQMMVQLLIVPIILRHTFHLLKPMTDGAKDNIRSLPEQQCAPQGPATQEPKLPCLLERDDSSPELLTTRTQTEQTQHSACSEGAFEASVDVPDIAKFMGIEETENGKLQSAAAFFVTPNTPILQHVYSV